MVVRVNEMAGGAAIKSEKTGDETATANPRKRARNTGQEASVKKTGLNFDNIDGPVEWKKIKQEQKVLKKKRKEKKHPDFYEASVAAKQLWERFRVKKETSIPKKARTEACNEAFKLLQPHLKRCLGLHDMSRVIQTIVEVGDRNARKVILDVIMTDIIEFCKNKYACHTIVKLLPCLRKEERQKMLSQLRGQIGKLLKHKYSARVLETLYSSCTSKQDRFQMLIECFGSEFKLFVDNSCASVDELLTKYPEKRERILTSMKEILDKVIGRGGYWKQNIVLELLCQYLSNCDEETRAEYINSVKDALVHMPDTREGANLALICIWHGTAHVRKAIIKNLKSKVVDVARKKFGHMILLAIFDCVDDTKLVSKAIIKELVDNLAQERGSTNLLLNQFARKVIYYLVCPRDHKMINDDVIKILEKGDGNVHSKKDMDKRRQELSEYALEMIPPILKEYGEDLHAILNDSCSALIVTGFLNTSTSEDFSAIFMNIAEWVCKVEKPRYHARLVRNLISKDEARKDTFLNILLKTMENYPKVQKIWLEDPSLKSILSP